MQEPAQTFRSAANWIWPIAFYALIWATSSSVVTVGQLSSAVGNVTGGQVSDLAFRQFWSHLWWIFVKGWHACEYGILFLLLRRALALPPKWLFVLVAHLALVDEFHQAFIPSRGGRLSDVTIDVLGALVAWSLTTASKQWALPKRVAFAAVLILCIFVFSMYPFGLIQVTNTLSSGTP